MHICSKYILGKFCKRTCKFFQVKIIQIFFVVPFLNFRPQLYIYIYIYIFMQQLYRQQILYQIMTLESSIVSKSKLHYEQLSTLPRCTLDQ